MHSLLVHHTVCMELYSISLTGVQIIYYFYHYYYNDDDC